MYGDSRERAAPQDAPGDFARHAIDYYLADCVNTGRAPEPPLSGDLTLHVGPETQVAILAAASAAGQRPDQWATEQPATPAGR